MNEQIDTALKRNRGYWFVDGFTEIAAGGFFILLAVIMLLRLRVLQNSASPSLISITGEIVAVKLVGGVAAILILWWLKDHFTYPRTGFIRGTHITSTQILIVIRNAVLFLFLPILGLLAISVLITSTASVLSSLPAWFPMGVSLIWAAVCFIGGEWMGLSRFRLLGGVILLSGIGVGIWQLFIGLPQPELLASIDRTAVSLGVLILICGVFIIFSGSFTFLRYRKENPTPYVEES